MLKAIVDGVEVEFEHGMSVLQVELAGAEIPRFYNTTVVGGGNRRMCLVEVEDQRGRACRLLRCRAATASWSTPAPTR